MSFDNHDLAALVSERRPLYVNVSVRAVLVRNGDGTSRCGHAGVCAWMRDAIGECAAQGNARNVRFERREFTHPDTLRPVARVQAAIGLREPINVRACPACGGNPNEQEMQPR